MKELLLKRLKKSKNKKGFTLIEIIVVLVILGILAAIAVPAVMGYICLLYTSSIVSPVIFTSGEKISILKENCNIKKLETEIIKID